jgi:hypothetical protein
MKKVILGHLFHREKEWISIVGPDEKVFNTCMKKCKAIWTRTHKCYLLPFDKNAAEQIMAGLSKVYLIDPAPLRQVLMTRKEKSAVPERKAVVKTRKISSEYDAGLRDWEMRDQ